jgi:hypothetical protein
LPLRDPRFALRSRREFSFGAWVLNPVLVSTMVLFSVIAGYIGWRRATKPIYRRTYVEPDPPEGMTRREYDRKIRGRRKRWRLVVTVFYAIMGAIGGIVFLLLLARR